MAAQCVTKVELSVSCDHLMDKDISSKSDPLCVLMMCGEDSRWYEVSMATESDSVQILNTNQRLKFNFCQNLKFLWFICFEAHVYSPFFAFLQDYIYILECGLFSEFATTIIYFNKPKWIISWWLNVLMFYSHLISGHFRLTFANKAS